MIRPTRKAAWVVTLRERTRQGCVPNRCALRDVGREQRSGSSQLARSQWVSAQSLAHALPAGDMTIAPGSSVLLIPGFVATPFASVGIRP